MRAVHVVGGGPAGVMAAFAAMREGASVRIFEKSAFPRHKVFGEFLSPAILPRAWPSLRIPSYAVIVSCLPVQANPRITTAPRRPTDGRAGHRAIGEKCCT